MTVAESGAVKKSELSGQVTVPNVNGKTITFRSGIILFHESGAVKNASTEITAEYASRFYGPGPDYLAEPEPMEEENENGDGN